jgi:aspartyl-tRNA synthetase
MEIKESYMEVLSLIGDLFHFMFSGLRDKFKKEIEIIKSVYGYEEFQFLDKPVILTFKEGCKMLRENGIEQSENEDISTEIEKKLGQIVKEKYNTDFYILHKYPISARPFYTMLLKDDPTFTCSYDIFMRGQEILSGAQRIHDTEFLKERAIAKGIDINTIQAYLNSFSLGAFPHGGCGVGLERVVMLYLGLYDTKKVSLFPRDPTRLSP